MGEAVEFSKLVTKFQQNGLRLRYIPKDGNCLFRAVAEQLPAGVKGDHNDVRLRTVDHMQATPHKFRPFCEAELGQPYDDYLARMRRDGVWGGEPELAAAADRFQLSVVVYDARTASKMQTYNGGGRGVVRLCKTEDHYHTVVAPGCPLSPRGPGEMFWTAALGLPADTTAVPAAASTTGSRPATDTIVEAAHVGEPKGGSAPVTPSKAPGRPSAPQSPAVETPPALAAPSGRRPPTPFASGAPESPSPAPSPAGALSRGLAKPVATRTSPSPSAGAAGHAHHSHSHYSALPSTQTAPTHTQTHTLVHPPSVSAAPAHAPAHAPASTAHRVSSVPSSAFVQSSTYYGTGLSSYVGVSGGYSSRVTPTHVVDERHAPPRPHQADAPLVQDNLGYMGSRHTTYTSELGSDRSASGVDPWTMLSRAKRGVFGSDWDGYGHGSMGVNYGSSGFGYGMHPPSMYVGGPGIFR